MSLDERVSEDLRNRTAVDLHDIQATLLRHRPEPYFGTHVFLHINDPHGGREFLRRLAPHIASAADWWNAADAWIAVRSPAQGWWHWRCRKIHCEAFRKHFGSAWRRVRRSFVTTEQTIRRTGTGRSVVDRFTSKSALSAIPKISGGAPWRRRDSSTRAFRASASC